MIRSHHLLVGAGLIATSAFLVSLTGGPAALAKGKEEEHLRYAATWADAVREARSRNAIIFATFHKDN
jgi:hypothetical protein